MTDKTALIVVDLQNDFCEGGALPVAGGLDLAYAVDLLVSNSEHGYDAVVTTQDWHEPLPSDNGGHFGDSPDFSSTWPVHCVATQLGAEIVYRTVADAADAQFFKGYGSPAYSGFQGATQGKSATLLGPWLLAREITAVDIVGIAGDVCVLATATDAVKLGFKARVVPELVVSIGGEDATRVVAKMIEEMQS